MLSRILFCIALLSSISLINGETMREFTNSQGSTLRAEILSVNRAEQVTLKRDDGRIFRDLPIDMFSNADRKYIRQWQANLEKALNNADIQANSDFTVTVGKRRDDDFNKYNDIDDRVVKYAPRVNIHNDEIKETFTDVRGTLIIVGQEILRKNEYAVLFREDFKLDLPPGEKTTLFRTKFRMAYDPDYGGQNYEGYLILIKNRQDKIIFLKASKGIWEDNVNKLLKAKKGYTYDRKFNHQIGSVIRLAPY